MVAVRGFAAGAANVEITGVTQTPGGGRATVNYTMSGLPTKTCGIRRRAVADADVLALTLNHLRFRAFNFMDGCRMPPKYDIIQHYENECS